MTLIPLNPRMKGVRGRYRYLDYGLVQNPKELSIRFEFMYAKRGANNMLTPLRDTPCIRG